MKIGGMELGTPVDIVVGGGAYAAGMAIDAFFFTGGLASAEVAAGAAAGALALKYGIQELFYRFL